MRRTLLALAALGACIQFATVTARSVETRDFLDDAEVCAWPGYDLGKPQSYYVGNGGTYPECSAMCFSKVDCKSFAYGDGTCLLYNVIAIYNHATNFSSPYRFYDITCEKKPTCGQAGYEYRLESIDYASGIPESECSKKCIDLANCKSYAYGNQECLIYDVPANGNVEVASGSPYKYYDRSCIKGSTSSTTKTTTKTSTTTKVPTANPTKASTTTTTKQSTTTKTTTTTTTKVMTTTLTISNQPFYCTALSK